MSNCNSCNQPILTNGCGCSSSPHGVIVGSQPFVNCEELDLCGDGCEETHSSKCIIYKGNTLMCGGIPNITTNTSVETIIQFLYAQICTLKASIANLQDTIENCCTNSSNINFISLGPIACAQNITGNIGVSGLSVPMISGESIVVKYDNLDDNSSSLTTLVLNTDYTLTNVGDIWQITLNYNHDYSGKIIIEATNNGGTNTIEYDIACPCAITVEDREGQCINGQTVVTFELEYINAPEGDIVVETPFDTFTFEKTGSPQIVTFNLPGTVGTHEIIVSFDGETCQNIVEFGPTSNCCDINVTQTGSQCNVNVGNPSLSTGSYFLDLDWLNAPTSSGTITLSVTGIRNSSAWTGSFNIPYNSLSGHIEYEMIIPFDVTNVAVNALFTGGCQSGSTNLTFVGCS